MRHVVLILGVAGFACAWLLAGCGGARFEKNVVRANGLAWRVGALGPAWRRVSVEREQLAFHHDDGGAIATSASCGADDVPLEVLTNHLLIGLEDRREVARARLTLDGRAALASDYEATLDGVPVALALVVVKKDGCTFDLSLVAPPDRFAARRADFDRFVAGFARAERE